MKYWIKTFGCQMNVHDSEKASGVLDSEGLTMASERSEADLIVFNTCSIREKAEQKFLSDLGRLKRLKDTKPDVKIAVMGCIAQQRGQELLARYPYVDYIIGPQNIHLFKDLVSKNNGVKGDTPPLVIKTAKQVLTKDNTALHTTDLPVTRTEAKRAWVSIMYGCNNYCTYCIVPFTRGPERSRPFKSITEEISALAREGVLEVTLLGQNVNSYRSDETGFPELLDRIGRIKGIRRIRFVTSHPKDLSEPLIERFKTVDTLCPHIHLPLQSGSDRVLKLMNRKYTYEHYRGLIERLRIFRPDISITSDIIAGFPGETDQDHAHTINALKEIRFDGLFSFKYSKRPNTAAKRMKEHLSEEEKLRRLMEIQSLQDEITVEKNMTLKGRVLEVFVESSEELDNENTLTGRTDTNKIVIFKGIPSLHNKFVKVKITAPGKHSLQGELS